MKDISLYVLDIAMNSVRAGAPLIEISLLQKDALLTLDITDNGCGMTKEQVERLSDPFYTTRKTRKVGLGIPFLRMLAEQTGGSVSVYSKSEAAYEDHGTKVQAVFHTDHIDFVPIGDMGETVLTLIQGNPDRDFVYRHISESFSVELDTREMRQVLGEGVPLNSYSVLSFIRKYLSEQYDNKI